MLPKRLESNIWLASTIGLLQQFNWRKSSISEGRIGKIYHFRGLFLQDWIVDPSFPLVWRLQKEIAGSGSHGDLVRMLLIWLDSSLVNSKR